MTELDAGAEQLLALARGAHEPSAADALRVRRALHARCLAAPWLLVPKTAKAAGLGGKALLGKVLVAAAIGSGAGALTGAAAIAWTSPPAELGAPRSAPADSARQAAPALEATGAAPARAPEPAFAVERALASAPRPSMPSSASAPAEGAQGPAALADMRAELDGLRRAQQLLHAGNSAAALAELAALDERVPHGDLLEERAATRAVAACSSGGNRAELLHDFSRRYPTSVHTPRVRAACSDGKHVEPKKGETESPGSEH